ncbi:MAG: SWIM zinc finger family protein [Methanothrix sp.]
MLNKTLAESPVTQGREAVKQLIAYHNHGVEPQEMPNFYRLTGGMVLVLNNKKDAYYVTTPKTCSCPAAIYNPGPCKHARKYFPQPKKEVATEEPTEGAKRLARPPEESIRPNTKAFRPFDSLPSEEKAATGVA